MTWTRRLPAIFVIVSLVMSMSSAIYERPPSSAYYTSGDVILTLVTDRMSWDEADQACSTVLGGSLVRIDSGRTDQAIRDFVNSAWDSFTFQDSWVGLQWRVSEPGGSRQLVWSDTCQPFSKENYNLLYTGGDDDDDDDERPRGNCYRIRHNYKYDRRGCSDTNSFICQSMDFPSRVPLSTDPGSGMMVVSKEASQECSAVCNQMYGCYRVSDLTNTSCVVDIVSDDASDDVKSLYKPFKIRASVLSLNQSQRDTITQKVNNLPKPTSQSVCDPQQHKHSVPNEMVLPKEVNVPMVMDSLQSCVFTALTASDSSSCLTVLPSASHLVHTTTIVDTITMTPQVTIAPTTVSYTQTITMTTQLFSSCSPEIHTELTTFTYTETMSGPGQMCSTVTPTSPNMSSQRLDQALSSIVSELTVSERSTSRWRARHTTARDDRVSSKAMGLVAMGFISLVMLFILGVDAVALYRRHVEGVGG